MNSHTDVLFSSVPQFRLPFSKMATVPIMSIEGSASLRLLFTPRPYHTHLTPDHDVCDFILCSYRQHVVPRFAVALTHQVAAVLGFDVHQDFLGFFSRDVTVEPSEMRHWAVRVEVIIHIPGFIYVKKRFLIVTQA